VALAAMAQEQLGAAAANGAEVGRIAVLPQDLEAERIAIVALAGMQTANMEDRAWTRQLALPGARRGRRDELIVALIAALGGVLAPRQGDRQTHRERRALHVTSLPH